MKGGYSEKKIYSEKMYTMFSTYFVLVSSFDAFSAKSSMAISIVRRKTRKDTKY